MKVTCAPDTSLDQKNFFGLSSDHRYREGWRKSRVRYRSDCPHQSTENPRDQKINHKGEDKWRTKISIIKILTTDYRISPSSYCQQFQLNPRPSLRLLPLWYSISASDIDFSGWHFRLFMEDCVFVSLSSSSSLIWRLTAGMLDPEILLGCLHGLKSGTLMNTETTVNTGKGYELSVHVIANQHPLSLLGSSFRYKTLRTSTS